VDPALEAEERVLGEQRVADARLRPRCDRVEPLVVEGAREARLHRRGEAREGLVVHVAPVRVLGDEEDEPVGGDAADGQERASRQLAPRQRADRLRHLARSRGRTPANRTGIR
jgi:hypothetical protein